MDQPVVDRRLDTRFGQPRIADTQAILRPGYSVSLVDLSSGGALIQGPRPLRPGARVHLQLVHGNRRVGIGGYVLRCAVAQLDSRQGVQYRGAVKFDHRCQLPWEAPALDGYRVPGDAGAQSHQPGQPLPVTSSVPSPRGDTDRD